MISNLEMERAGLENAEAQVVVRKRRVGWLESITEDWDLKERTRWREDVPGVPRSKPRSGRKCTRSKSKAKPYKLKRMRLRSLKSGINSMLVSGDVSGPASSQPGLGLPRTGSGLEAMDDGREDVVILNGDDSPAKLDVGGEDTASGSIKTVKEKKPRKR